MTNAREKIFANIRGALHRGTLSQTEKNKLEKRMQEHPRGVLPERARLPHEQLIHLFIEQAKKAGSIVEKTNAANESAAKAFCGIAETGTIVMLSSKENPTAQNFLPEKHIVLLNEKNIVAYYEDAWDLIRAHNQIPRCVNFITGPSRTGDIEQKVEIGIHGPKELIILLSTE